MKKNYELVEVKVISLENEDVITGSNSANRSSMSNFLNDNFDLGDFGTQDLG